MGKKVADFAATYADREAIRYCLTSYSRGSDRIDRVLMSDAYWPGATDNHGGMYNGTAAGLIDHAVPLLQQLKHSTHFLGNMLIDVEGDFAKSETYVLVYYSLDTEEGGSNFVVGGRYLDNLEKHDDEWRIARRHLVIDWSRNFAEPSDKVSAFVGYVMEGGRKPADPSYSLFDSDAAASS